MAELEPAFPADPPMPQVKVGAVVLGNCGGSITPASHGDIAGVKDRNRHARVFVPAGSTVRVLAEVDGHQHLVVAADAAQDTSFFIRVRGDADVADPTTLVPEDD